jgi:hypothetical protein
MTVIGSLFSRSRRSLFSGKTSRSRRSSRSHDWNVSVRISPGNGVCSPVRLWYVVSMFTAAM